MAPDAPPDPPDGELADLYGPPSADRCRFCDHPPAAEFAMDRGCWVFPDDRRQVLCMWHAVEATPRGGMELVKVIETGWRDELIRRFGEPTDGP